MVSNFLRPPPVKLTSRFRDVVQRRTRNLAACSVAPADSQEKAPTPSPQTSRPRSPTRARDVVKRKVAVLVGYDGARYHGLQRNVGVETVSDELERALHAVGAISDDNFGFLEKIKWQAAARTDRGVSAAGNVISAKLLFRREEHEAGKAFHRTTERLNRQLPEDVRVFAVKHITNSFSARTSCGERWYEYLLPLAMLDTTSRSAESMQEILKTFEGAHSFHNYTVGVDHTLPPRPQAKRYITHTSCEPITLAVPATDGDKGSSSEWLRVRIRGQSFVLHQIRKMVSMAILCHNGAAPPDSIQRSFHSQTLVNIPPAPAVGLFLDCCHFRWYNERHQASLPEPLSLIPFDAVREQFKQEVILPSIARRSVSEDALGVYFRTVEAHPVTFP